MPSGSHYYFMIDQYCAYRFRPSPEWEEVGVNLKSKKKFEKIYELKNFTCKRYWLIESSWFWNRFRSQNFWNFSAFPSIQLSFNGLVLFFPHQIEPSAHRGPVLKNFRSKKFLLKIIVSPLVILNDPFFHISFYVISAVLMKNYFRNRWKNIKNFKKL